MVTVLRKALRRALPEAPRRAVAQVRRLVADRLAGISLRLARQRDPGEACRPCVAIDQPIRQTPLWEGKLVNLRLGVELIDGVRIGPGQVFSFWALVGRPTPERGFAIGRSIRADATTGDPGGGLCQLSGIAYELGLRAGLYVVERHAHSRDLYTSEDERFTPLGLDATVVWPWKDLRLENRLGVAVTMRFGVEGMMLKAWLECAESIPGQDLELERIDYADHRAVAVRRAGQIVSRDRYAI